MPTINTSPERSGNGVVKSEYQPTKDTPPMFFAFAMDDRVAVDGSFAMAKALKNAGIPVELHMYYAGGHGFGLRKSDNPCHTWPARCAEWLEHRGLLK